MRKTLTALIAAIAAACFSAGPATAQTDLQDIVDPATPQDPDPSDNIDPEDIIDLGRGNDPSAGDDMERRCTEAFKRSRASESCTLASVWTDSLIVPAGSCGLNAKCKTLDPGMRTLDSYTGPLDDVRRLSNCDGRLVAGSC